MDALPGGLLGLKEQQEIPGVTTLTAKQIARNRRTRRIPNAALRDRLHVPGIGTVSQSFRLAVALNWGTRPTAIGY